MDYRWIGCVCGWVGAKWICFSRNRSTCTYVGVAKPCAALLHLICLVTSFRTFTHSHSHQNHHSNHHHRLRTKKLHVGYRWTTGGLQVGCVCGSKHVSHRLMYIHPHTASSWFRVRLSGLGSRFRVLASGLGLWFGGWGFWGLGFKA